MEWNQKPFIMNRSYGLRPGETKQSDAALLGFSKLNESFGESRGIKGMKLGEDVCSV